MRVHFRYRTKERLRNSLEYIPTEDSIRNYKLNKATTPTSWYGEIAGFNYEQIATELDEFLNDWFVEEYVQVDSELASSIQEEYKQRYNRS